MAERQRGAWGRGWVVVERRAPALRVSCAIITKKSGFSLWQFCPGHCTRLRCSSQTPSCQGAGEERDTSAETTKGHGLLGVTLAILLRARHQEQPVHVGAEAWLQEEVPGARFQEEPHHGEETLGLLLNSLGPEGGRVQKHGLKYKSLG